ncbi:hypothetical protein LTR62_001907 [Meristemomyces frigidus]|uniref:Protein BTN n=1 Tax=Meristemomyces frigidus TaxID=1508187 RepID=A0AAN7YM66_9PEZI|nr:hypothetical protein LTR62_001907 [Meristemomyces frigidus]
MHLTRAKARSALAGIDLRVAIAFWLFGLINNIFYVIILSAALDLVGPNIPKATVLLSSIIPGLATKLIVPYLIHLIPYSARVVVLAVLSTCGMLIVALSPAHAVVAKVAGIVLANISSGAGEVHFLALTHFYGTTSLAAWGSGTGGAGLLGAGAYALATTTFGFSVRTTLLSSAVIPVGMVLSFFCLLPLDPLKTAGSKGSEYDPLPVDEQPERHEIEEEAAGLLTRDESAAAVSTISTMPRSGAHFLLQDLQTKLHRAKGLLIPYMLPLFLVYASEYTINQGVAPTLLFPLASTPFKQYRAFYPTYGAIYQLGVFISRSSLPFIRIRTLYVPSVLQLLNLVLLTAQALFMFIPSVWLIFGIVLWEGLLGGLVYVSTYAAVREEVEERDREFSLGAVTVSDSAGIFVAGLVGVVLEGQLCSWQVAHGRDWCRRL